MLEIKELLDNINNFNQDKLNYIKEKLNKYLLNDNLNENINNIKTSIIENESVNFQEENVLNKIKEVINTIPNNATPKEKVRYVYMKLGQIFSYDYRVAYDISHATNKEIDFNNFIGKYQTCIQISNILNEILNNIDGVKSTIIPRVLDNLRGNYGHDHLANEVEIQIDDENTETYIMDLSLDLYLIQSNCKTKHFGYEMAPTLDKTYDIIPQIDNIEMDEKLGFNTNYTDNILNDLENELKNNNITDKLSIVNKLLKKYKSYHEAKQFVNMIFTKLNINYEEYNIFKKNESDEIINFKTIYRIEDNNEIKWFIYSNNLGFININTDIINELLNNNWETKSNTLFERLSDKKML